MLLKIKTEFYEKIFRDEQVEQFKPIEKKTLPPITHLSLIASICYIFSLFDSVSAESNISYEIDGNEINWKPNYPNDVEFINLTGNFKYCDITKEVKQ
jgi:hypothetical protein